MEQGIKNIVRWISNVQWHIDTNGWSLSAEEIEKEEIRVKAWKQALNALGWDYDEHCLGDQIK